MGKHITEPGKKRYTLDDLLNHRSGVISFYAEIANELNQPDVFVTIAKSADIKGYGYSYSHFSNGSGAALNARDAKYAAIGETMERYCLSIVHPEDLVLGSYKDLLKKGLIAVPPDKWSFFDKQQVIEPFAHFTEDTLMAWVETASIVDNISKYVPAALVHLPYYRHFEAQGERLITVAVSTGAACAVTRQEAVFKGICELVERDAFMITWRNQLPCPKITIDEKSGIYETYLSKFMRPGLKFDIYYTTLDLGMPSFWGVLSGTNSRNKWHLVGGAAHPDPEVAVLKTLLELAQGLAWKDYKGEEEFPVVEGFTNVDSFEKRLELYVYNDMSDAFKFLPKEATINLSDLKKSHGYNGRNTGETLREIIEDFRQREYDILVADVTTPEADECGIYITKVLIPALEVMDGDHRFPYLGGKRWKEVPVKLGLKNYDSEAQVNPYPHPYP